MTHANTPNETSMSPLLLTVDQAAQAVALSRDSMYRLLAEGELPSVMYRSARRIRLADLRVWVDGLPTASL